MVRKGFRKVRDLLIALWYFIRQQPLKPPAALEEQLSGMPETQAQRLLQTLEAKPSTQSRVATVCGSKGNGCLTYP